MKTWRIRSIAVRRHDRHPLVCARARGRAVRDADALTHHYDNARLGATLTETFLNTDTRELGTLRQALDALRRWAGRGAASLRLRPAHRHDWQSEHAARAGHVQCRHHRDDAQHRVRLRRRQGSTRARRAHRAALGDLARTAPPGGKDIDMWSTNDPEWGILSTPVISADKKTLYVVAWHDDGPQGLSYRLHALNLQNGAHRQPPVVVGVPSTDPSNPCRGQSTFNPCSQKQRAGLLLAGGVLYVAFGGDGNRGALRAFDAQTLTQRAAWTPTPTGKRRRHLAVRAGSRRRRRGQRLPDDRQRDLRRQPGRRPELRQQLREAEARRHEPRRQGLLHALQLRVSERARSGSRIGRPGAAAGHSRADRQRWQSRECSTSWIRTNMGKHSAPAARTGLQQPEHRAAGHRLR